MKREIERMGGRKERGRTKCERERQSRKVEKKKKGKDGKRRTTR